MKMARILAIGLCLIAVSVVPGLAEPPSAGAEVGVSASRVSPAESGQSISMGPGLLAGVYAVAQIAKPVGIQFELVYAQKYSRLTGTTDLRLDYIEIPVLAKMALFKGFYILEGVSFAFPVRAMVHPASGVDQDIKSHTTSPDIGMVIGGGRPVGKFAIEGRYDGGFRKVDSSANGPVQRNRSYSLIVRVHF